MKTKGAAVCCGIRSFCNKRISWRIFCSFADAI
jgi:hypothetical protein